jgi:Uma2 family endonuclease
MGQPGGGCEVEAEVRLLDDYLAVPDLAGGHVESVPEMPDENPITVVPDWACEVLSPTTARDDRRLKLPLDARAGVGWIWLIDVETAQVEIYETVRARATFALAASETSSLPPFDRDFDVAAWFATPSAAPPGEPGRSRRAKPA